jgi:hypothetical protein
VHTSTFGLPAPKNSVTHSLAKLNFAMALAGEANGYCTLNLEEIDRNFLPIQIS